MKILDRLKMAKRAVDLYDKINKGLPLDDEDKAFINEMQDRFNAMSPEEQHQATEKAIKMMLKLKGML